MLRLRRVDEELARRPIDVAPPQAQWLARDAQTAVPGQREQQAPLGVRALVEDLGRHLARDEEVAVVVRLHAALDVGERVFRDQLAADGGAEELFRDRAP